MNTKPVPQDVIEILVHTYETECGFFLGELELSMEAMTKVVKKLHELQRQRSQGQEAVAYLRSSGSGTPVVTARFLFDRPEFRNEFETPLFTHPPQPQSVKDAAEQKINDVFAAEIAAAKNYGMDDSAFRLQPFAKLGLSIETEDEQNGGAG